MFNITVILTVVSPMEPRQSFKNENKLNTQYLSSTTQKTTITYSIHMQFIIIINLPMYFQHICCNLSPYTLTDRHFITLLQSWFMLYALIGELQLLKSARQNKHSNKDKPDKFLGGNANSHILRVSQPPCLNNLWKAIQVSDIIVPPQTLQSILTMNLKEMKVGMMAAIILILPMMLKSMWYYIPIMGIP